MGSYLQKLDGRGVKKEWQIVHCALFLVGVMLGEFVVAMAWGRSCGWIRW